MDIYKAKKKAPDVVGYVEEMLDCEDNVVSATGYTGLTPSAVLDYDEAQNYNDIYDFPNHVKQPRAATKPEKKEPTKSANKTFKNESK